MKSLKKFEFKKFGGVQSKYDWPKLLDGGIYQLEKDIDFTASPGTFIYLARKQARKMGKILLSGHPSGEDGKKVENTVVIQAQPAPQDVLDKWAAEDAEAPEADETPEEEAAA